MLKFLQRFYKDEELFHSSSYSKESNYYDETNNSVVDKMADETIDVPIKCFVGLKARM